MSYNGSCTSSCWKLHKCVNCSTIFRYMLTRKITSTGSTEEQAREQLAQNAVKAMNEGVDSHPCPTCGLVQPEMVGSGRSSNHGCMMWLALVLMVGLMIALGMEASIFGVLVVGSALALALAGGQYLVAANNPNRIIRDNHRKAQKEVADGKVFADKVEDAPRAPQDLSRLTDGTCFGAYGLLAAGLLLILFPEVLRMGLGWPLNEGWFPAVIGPKDQSTYYFHRPLSSIKGYWKGSVKAVLTEPGGPKTLTATCQDNQWGGTISAKSSETNQNVNLWTKVTFPDDPSLARTEGKVKLDVDYSAPVMSGDKKFRTTPGSVSETQLVRFASAGSGGTYLTLAWIGVVAGPVLLFAAGWWLKGRADSLQGNQPIALPLDALSDVSDED